MGGAAGTLGVSMSGASASGASFFGMTLDGARSTAGGTPPFASMICSNRTMKLLCFLYLPGVGSTGILAGVCLQTSASRSVSHAAGEPGISTSGASASGALFFGMTLDGVRSTAGRMPPFASMLFLIQQ